MKIFTAPQIRAIDAYTIAHEPIPSIDLMERASAAFVEWFVNTFTNHYSIKIFAGIGNNGGDGLAVGRILQEVHGYEVAVYVVRFSNNVSPDFARNEERLSKFHNITNELDFPEITDQDIVIDAIFGSGLSRPIEGFTAKLIQKINESKAQVVSIDIASGLFCNALNTDQSIIKPAVTISFQFPKLSFLLPQNEAFVGDWQVVDIGLHPQIIADTPTPFEYVDEEFVYPLVQKRSKYAHKGTFGHVLIIAGSYGKIGAALLAGKAALRNGAGLVSVHLPKCGYEMMQTAVPEIMCSIDADPKYISELPDLSKYKAIAIGPGIDKEDQTKKVLKLLIEEANSPLVLDADALNLLAENPVCLTQLPENSILTPHPKEFERLVGQTNDHYERLEKLQAFSKQYQVIVVLKGAHTAIAVPEGKVFFNSTGNPGMATAGSGDVLTGMIAALLGQGYAAKDAAVLGVYLHGAAGDGARDEVGEVGVIASDIIAQIGNAYRMDANS
ncbi:MAG: NAD(P)H-hydrate dehydratase [Flammeovirgaceae bacterium]